MRIIIVVLLALSLLLPLPAIAQDQADLMKKMEQLSKELEQLKMQLQEVQKKEVVREERISQAEKKADEAAAMWPSWFELSGDFRARYDYLNGGIHNYMQYNPFGLYTPVPGGPSYFVTPVNGYTAQNTNLLTNRLGVNMKVKATEDIQFKARLLMYKVWGSESDNSSTNNYFADRVGIYDGTIGHIPQNTYLLVDRAYATWSNIADLPVWFSVGRRPSTNGVPENLRLNTEKIGTAGVPSFLINYAFDGLSVGVAPDIETLPGAYAKLCYGKGFDSGYRTPTNSIKDTDFLGINIVPYDTENLHLEIQWNEGFNIFNTLPDGGIQKVDTGLLNGGQPSGSYINVTSPVSTNLGNIWNLGALGMGKIENVGPGDLNLFLAGAMSQTLANSNLFKLPFGVTPTGQVFSAGYGLMYNEGNKANHTGWFIYPGVRYDIKSTKTKVGFEYNYGTEYWITFVPAADDIWTSKLGTRGSVYELYVIQELPLKPISKWGKAFFRLGYQYYAFTYTGSNNWVGAPTKISNLNAFDPRGTQPLAPVKYANDIYFTFDVVF